jgi:CDP-glucose 4,6-dehydratase
MSDFWKGRRVLVTGHTGFKGAWLSEWLLLLGARVHGYALAPPTTPALFDQLGLAQRLEHEIGDVRDLEGLRACVARAQPEVLFHLAAQSLVRRSYVEPLETYAVNVMGTANVLEACREETQLRAIVVVTTDKCYENQEWHWGYRETEALGGHDPYSSSKACAEIVTAAYRRSFFNGARRVPLASARAGNVIGGGDWAEDRLIPDVLRAHQAGRAVEIRHPEAIRPWQHVLEPLRGYLTLAERLAGDDGARFAEPWNFGPDTADEKPVRWVLDRLRTEWPQLRAWEVARGEHPHEATYLKLDCAKARARLGWQPAINLTAALKLTIDWYRQVQTTDARDLTRLQLQNYMALLEKSR